jgi:myosin heavy subunit
LCCLDTTTDGQEVEEDAAVFDLVLLSEIDEKHVIQNISNMYYEDLIYCYIGNVIVSMNPFKTLPIYDDVGCCCCCCTCCRTSLVCRR